MNKFVIMNKSLPHIVEFPTIGSQDLGYISVAEFQKNVHFEINRIYWTYFTPNNVVRGGHSHRKLEQYIFAVNGIIKITTEDRKGEKIEWILDQPNKGLYLGPSIWRDIVFSHSAVLLCLASEIYEESDYIRDYQLFKKSI